MLAVTIASACACKKKETPPADTKPDTGKTITAVVKAEKVAPGYTRKASYFRLPTIAGKDIDLAASAGKPVLIMFFTETCPYCRKAAPFIERVYKTYTKKGLVVAGICIQPDPEAGKAFAQDLATTFPIAYDGRKIYKNYKAQGVPFIYLLNSSHDIHEMWGGYSPEYDAEIIEKVEAVLKGPL